VPFEKFAARHIVVSEKVDGANCAISYTREGRVLLQSRSRFLLADSIDGPYAGFRDWAIDYEDVLWPVLRDRYVMYGEWVLAKQIVFYDALPSSFLELDLYDKVLGGFLSTPRRRQLLRTLPIVSAPVLFEGKLDSLDELTPLLGPSRFKTPGWRDELLSAVAEACVSDGERWVRETDPSDDMEGLYVKAEAGGFVTGRAKYVRDGYRQPFNVTHSGWMRTRRVQNIVRRVDA
jgi:hypothetical protein